MIIFVSEQYRPFYLRGLVAIAISLSLLFVLQPCISAEHDVAIEQANVSERSNPKAETDSSVTPPNNGPTWNNLLAEQGHINATNTNTRKTNLVDRQRRSLLVTVTMDNLSSSDRELAEQLEIWQMLEELFNRQNEPPAERKTFLRQKIRETIMESYFDAASVEAEAEREQDSLEALRQVLLANRDKNVEINNATNFILSGGLNTVGSVLGFTNRLPPFPGNFSQMLAGVLSAGMSTYALKQNSGGKTRGFGHPTVLAELFGRPVDDRTEYPESVWRFLHGTSRESPTKTRVQALEDRWINRHELENHGALREQLKLDLVCGMNMDKKLMTISDLSDQINMVADISTMAALMTHHLRDLLHMIDSDISN